MLGDDILAQGPTFGTKKLKPGTRTITVMVSDDEATTEEEVTLVINKEEESPGFGALLAVLATIAGLVLMEKRRRQM